MVQMRSKAATELMEVGFDHGLAECVEDSQGQGKEEEEMGHGTDLDTEGHDGPCKQPRTCSERLSSLRDEK